jgi:hypothetical protein
MDADKPNDRIAEASGAAIPWVLQCCVTALAVQGVLFVSLT